MKNKIIVSLPDSFATEEQAGEFWDTHSAADYIEYLEETDDVFDFLNNAEEDIYSLTDGKPFEQ